MAQRLIKKLCPNCKKKSKEKIPKKYNKEFKIKKALPYFEKGKCDSCSNRGYKGRTAAVSFLPISKEIQHLLTKDNPEEKINEFLEKNNYTSLRKSIFNKLTAGITSLEEIERNLTGNI